jgi:hypothetical protein
MSETRPEWAPASIDLDRPSSARVWDYFLGGSYNFAVDRRVAEAAIAFKPGIVATVREAMAPGSYLVVQHATHDGQPRATIDMSEMWNANSPEPMYWRGAGQIEKLLEGFTLLDPGVVLLPLWRPEPEEAERAKQDPERYASYAAVAVKPDASG